MNAKNTIAILDDEPLILAALQGELSGDYDILYANLTAAEFQDNLQDHQPDLVLLDLLLGDGNGVEVARMLRATYPNVRILILSIDSRRESFRQLLHIGIDGFLSKKASAEEIRKAIKAILQGNKYYGKDSLRLINDVQRAIMDGKEPVLTPLEIKILYACCEGKSTKDIGATLKMSPRTVEAHKQTLFVKLGVDSTPELIVKAIQQGIINL